MARIVITGANRGLGLEFARAYAARGDEVLALARRPDEAAALQELAAGENLAVAACATDDDASVLAAAAVAATRWSGLDLLINNAGVAGATGSGLAQLDFTDVRAVFETNVLGPLRMCRALLPLLRRGDDPKVAQITSRMGSIADNESGGWWAYRISKAGLNMANANLALELRGADIATVVLHPGWVRTDMGGGAAPLDAATSVAGMMQVIDGLTLAATGAFRDYSGVTVPW
ncbi:MAG: SDR family oxidoreductase [Planctomycetota bacterium]